MTVEMVHSDLSAQKGIKFINEKPCVQNFYPGKSKLHACVGVCLERPLHEYLNVKNMCLLPRGLFYEDFWCNISDGKQVSQN